MYLEIFISFSLIEGEFSFDEIKNKVNGEIINNKEINLKYSSSTITQTYSSTNTWVSTTLKSKIYIPKNILESIYLHYKTIQHRD